MMEGHLAQASRLSKQMKCNFVLSAVHAVHGSHCSADAVGHGCIGVDPAGDGCIGVDTVGIG